MRVLHLSTWNVRCGIADYCADLVRSLNDQGVTNDVVPLCSRDWQTATPVDVARLWSRVVERAAEADVVHIQHEHAFFGYGRGDNYAMRRFGELLTALRRLPRPVVATFHTPPMVSWPRGFSIPELKTKLHCLNWRRYVFRHFGVGPGQARGLVHTPATRWAYARLGLPPESLHVVRHPCRVPRPATLDRATAKQQLGLPADACLLTMFGFLEPYKGHEVAIEALEHLPETFHLAILGGTNPMARHDYLERLLEKLAARKSLQSRVRMVGYVEPDVAAQYFAATDLCLAPYLGDTVLSASGAVTWAMSSGRPTIASKIDAFLTTQQECDGMFMVTPDCVRELAWAIERLHANPAMQARLVAISLDYCRRNSWEASARATIGIYEDLLEGAGSSSRKPAALAA